MRIFTILFCLMVCSIPSMADTLHVPGEYAEIQLAIDAAVNGDIVLVARGTYQENIDFLGKEIEVIADEGPFVTEIDGSNPPHHDYSSVVSFRNSEGNGSVLRGFTLANGWGNLYDDPQHGQGYCGGGIFCGENTSPTIVDNIIKDNWAPMAGGGLFCKFASPVIRGCTFDDNYGGSRGGGTSIDESTVSLIDCTFIDNHSSMSAGAMFNEDSQILVERCRFIGNTAWWNAAGVFNYDCAELKFKNCLFENSSCDNSGGAMMNSFCEPVMHNVCFIGNQVGNYGGAIYNVDCPNVDMYNCTLLNNSAGSKGGAIYCTDSTFCHIRNSILWDNFAYHGKEIWIGTDAEPSSVDIQYSDMMSGQPYIHVDTGCTLDWGAGMISEDPLFVYAPTNDYHLTYPSPCRDAGNNALVFCSEDMESDPRIAYGTVDMGCDEFYNHFYCTGNLTPGGFLQGKFTGIPGTAPVGLFIGSGLLETPLSHRWGTFFLEAPWFLIPLGVPIGTDGVLTVTSYIPIQPAAPYNVYMQALIGLNSDSLTNFFVLEVRK